MVVSALVALALVTLFPSKTDSVKQSRIALKAFEQKIAQTAKPADNAWVTFKQESENDLQKKDYKALYVSANQTYDKINRVSTELAAIPIPQLHTAKAHQLAWKALDDTRARYTMLSAAAQGWIKIASLKHLDSDQLSGIKWGESQAYMYQQRIPEDFKLARNALGPTSHP